MTSDKIRALKSISVFKQLHSRQLKQITQITSFQQFAARQVIYMPSDPRERLYAILKGKVKLAQLSPEGKELVLCILGEGEIFGEICLFDHGPQNTLAAALEDAEIISIDCGDLADFMNEDAEVAAALGKHIGDRLKALEQRLSDFAFKDVAQRLAGLLADMARDHGTEEDGGDIVIEMKITHQDLAGLIGSTRETTTTTLNQFREKGLIDFQRGRIMIMDIVNLEKAANRRPES
jgi:CRP/FNR family transcriptional regulator